MKYSILLSLLLLLIACKKEKEESSPYIGSWEMRDISGTGLVNPNDIKPGNGNIIKFVSDSVYIYVWGELVSRNKYHIANDTCLVCYDQPRIMNRLYMEDETEVTPYQGYTYLETQKDTLVKYSYYTNGSNIFERYKFVKVADR